MDLNKNIKFLGHVNNKKKEELLYNSDIFLYPSIWEGFGLSLIEAMVFGIPVITTRVSAIPEIIIDNKTGFLINEGDYKELANKIIYILSNKKNIYNIKKNAIKHVLNKFKLDEKVDELVITYKNTLKKDFYS
jgi:glycosyltransferase involved in cell wall biosynthesis